jgi:hypothetical protein
VARVAAAVREGPSSGSIVGNTGLVVTPWISDARDRGVLAVFPFGSPEFVRLREEFWLRTFAVAIGSGTSLVFTFAPEPSVPSGSPSGCGAPSSRPAGGSAS